jgi:hypothetical protein
MCQQPPREVTWQNQGTRRRQRGPRSSRLVFKARGSEIYRSPGKLAAALTDGLGSAPRRGIAAQTTPANKQASLWRPLP